MNRWNLAARLCAGLSLLLVAAFVLVARSAPEPAQPAGLRLAGAEVPIFRAAEPWTSAQRADHPRELGLRFGVTRPGAVVALRYYRTGLDPAAHTARVWSRSGALLAETRFPAYAGRGWQVVRLDQPVQTKARQEYVVSYRVSRDEYYPVRSREFGTGAQRHGALVAFTGVWGKPGTFPRLGRARSNYLVDVLWRRERGPWHHHRPTPTAVPSESDSASDSPTTTAPTSTSTPTRTGTYAPTRVPTRSTTPSDTVTSEPTSTAPTSTAPTSTPPTSPAPTSTAPSTPSTPSTPATSAPTSTPGGGFPDDSNTGVPDGTLLSRYTGSCTITKTVTLSAVDATGCGALLIRAPGVTIERSLLPRIDATSGGSASVSITDSTVTGGDWSDGAVWGSGITLLRDEVTGGQHNVHCGDNCTVVDSWLHDQYEDPSASFHNNAFISNGGSHMVLQHNTLHCTASLNSNDGGCTADLSLFGDFDPISDVLVQDNLFVDNHVSISYCAYGGSTASKDYPTATGVRFIDNTFERGTNGKCGVFGAVTDFARGGSGNQWTGNVWSDGAVLNP